MTAVARAGGGNDGICMTPAIILSRRTDALHLMAGPENIGRALATHACTPLHPSSKARYLRWSRAACTL